LSAEEITAYREEGLVIPKYRLPAEKLARLRGGLDQLIAENPGVRGEKLISAHIRANPGEGVRGNEVFLEFAHDPDVLDRVEAVIGPDIILWGAHMFAKPPRDGKEVPWHQDGHYWPIRPLATCTVWVALDDSTRENGAMRYIAGSHKMGTFTHLTDTDDRLALNQVLQPGQVDESQARDVELQAGQMSLHDVHLVHGSPPNFSDKRRAGLALRYMPATSHFDRSISSLDPVASFQARPIWLVRGIDRTGKNDFNVGHSGPR
jgi:ectoine hydroxylase-related dioxygenase (phytanoyl-CoA dioxygenase family)